MSPLEYTSKATFLLSYLRMKLAKRSLLRPFNEIINNHSYWEIFCWPVDDYIGHMHLPYFHRGLPSGLL